MMNDVRRRAERFSASQRHDAHYFRGFADGLIAAAVLMVGVAVAYLAFEDLQRDSYPRTNYTEQRP